MSTSQTKKVKPKGAKPWADRRLKTLREKLRRRKYWNATRWQKFNAELDERRDRPRRSPLMAIRQQQRAEREYEAWRKKRNAELYPARQARMIALNEKRREERQRNWDWETAQMMVRLVLENLDEAREIMRERGITPPLIMRR